MSDNPFAGYEIEDEHVQSSSKFQSFARMVLTNAAVTAASKRLPAHEAQRLRAFMRMSSPALEKPNDAMVWDLVKKIRSEADTQVESMITAIDKQLGGHGQATANHLEALVRQGWANLKSRTGL